MTGSPTILTTIFAFLLMLGPLVLIHELGHYLVGRWFGVKAQAFSIGFGKELVGWTDRRGTRWKLSALPLGGYVQFAGDMNPSSAPSAENDGLTPQERAQTFHAKPLWQRALIVLAGPMTNLVLCIAIYAGFYYGYGKPVVDPEVAGFSELSSARQAGMKVGDRIVAIDGANIESATEVAEKVAYFPGSTLEIAVERDGRRIVLPVPVNGVELTDRLGNKTRLGEIGLDFAVPVVSGLAEGSPAQAAGMRVGDRIVAVGETAVTSFSAIPELIKSRAGERITVTVVRDGTARVLPLTVGTGTEIGEDGKEHRVGRIGIQAGSGRMVPVGALDAVGLGVSRSVQTVELMVTGIRQIITGDRSVQELGGPIKIARYSGAAFEMGGAAFLEFAALISINLAFINLLPIPGLDGGHLAFYAAEAVRRRPLGVRSQEWAIRTGVALVLALMVFVTVNDLVTLPIFGG